VVELRSRALGVIGCFASPAALDGLHSLDALDAADARELPRGSNVVLCRTAPDEAMILVSPERLLATIPHIVEALTAADEDALIVDTTEGWSVWTLEGPDARRAFSYVSGLRLPESGYTVGDVAHVPTRIVVGSSAKDLDPAPRIDLIVPSMWRDYLRERVVMRCAPVGVHESRADQGPQREGGH
jgi:hypothetical protein